MADSDVRTTCTELLEDFMDLWSEPSVLVVNVPPPIGRRERSSESGYESQARQPIRKANRHIHLTLIGLEHFPFLHVGHTDD